MEAGTPGATMTAPLETWHVTQAVIAPDSVNFGCLFRNRGACNTWAGISTSGPNCLSSRDESPGTGEAGCSCRAGNERSACGTLFVHDGMAGKDRYCHLTDGRGLGVSASLDDSRALSWRMDMSDPCSKDRVQGHTAGDRAGEVRAIDVRPGKDEARCIGVATREDRRDLRHGGTSPWRDGVHCGQDPWVGTTDHERAP